MTTKDAEKHCPPPTPPSYYGHAGCRPVMEISISLGQLSYFDCIQFKKIVKLTKEGFQRNSIVITVLELGHLSVTFCIVMWMLLHKFKQLLKTYLFCVFICSKSRTDFNYSIWNFKEAFHIQVHIYLPVAFHIFGSVKVWISRHFQSGKIFLLSPVHFTNSKFRVLFGL